MSLIDTVKKTILKHNMLEKDDTVIIGISGGPDSVALLHVLHDLREEYEIALIASHVNYKLRSQESEDDEEFVEKLCGKLEIPLYKKTCKLKEGEKPSSIQERARDARYDFFEELRRRRSANKIAVGHNLDDSVETIILNLVRGSGSKGMSGIPPTRGKIIRPLIQCSRGEILEYLHANKLEYRLDSSNFENKYLRNKIRNLILPQLEDITNPELNKRIFSIGEVLGEEDDYLERTVANEVDKICSIRRSQDKTTVEFSIDEFNEYHVALKRRFIRNAISRVAGNLDGFGKKHIDDILELAARKGRERRIHLPRETEAITSYNALLIQKKSAAEKKPGKIVLKVPGITSIREEGEFIKAEIIANPVVSNVPANEAFLDYSKCGPLFIRYRKKGDAFKPFGMKGTKKIKDYFIDKKVPKYRRDGIPLVTSDSTIVWVVGFTIDEGFKVSSKTERVLHLVYTKGSAERH